MIISERIFQILKEKEMTQKEFSNNTGIAQSTISDWKTKKTNPAADKIMIICDTLDITPYELLSGAESEKFKQLDYVIVDKSMDEYILIETYGKLKQNRKMRLMGYLQALSEEE